MFETTEKVTKRGKVIKVLAADGYSIPEESTLLKMTNTGNGFVCKFPSYSSCHQENYVCLNYAEAEYVYLAMKAYYDNQ